MKKALFTVNLGGYDKVLPTKPQPGWDFILISDSDETPAGWTNYKVTPKQETRYAVRYYWHNFHSIFEYGVSMLIPAHSRVNFELNEYYEKFKEYDIVTFKNPYYKNIQEEAMAVIRNGQAPRDEVMNAFTYVIKEGFPLDFGLFALGGTMRQDNEKTREFYRILSELTQKLTHREQLLFPYVWWKYGNELKIKVIETPYYEVYECHR